MAQRGEMSWRVPCGPRFETPSCHQLKPVKDTNNLQIYQQVRELQRNTLNVQMRSASFKETFWGVSNILKPKISIGSFLLWNIENSIELGTSDFFFNWLWVFKRSFVSRFRIEASNQKLSKTMIRKLNTRQKKQKVFFLPIHNKIIEKLSSAWQ